MATDYATYEINSTLESLKNEESYVASAFEDSYKYNDLRGLALKLQDLLLMEKGTNPAAMDMGCAIRTYLFEHVDDITLGEMNAMVSSQQRKYLPSDVIKSLEFIRSPREDEPNKLYLFVHLNEYDEQYKTKYFAVGLASSSSTTSKVFSELYI